MGLTAGFLNLNHFGKAGIVTNLKDLDFGMKLASAFKLGGLFGLKGHLLQVTGPM